MLRKSDYYVSESAFSKSFKSIFICACIDNLTNDSLKTFMKNTNDIGIFTDIEIVSYSIAKEADSIGRIFSSKIIPIHYEDAGFGKPIVSGCINLGLSEEVNRYLKKRYKKYLKDIRIKVINKSL